MEKLELFKIIFGLLMFKSQLTEKRLKLLYGF